ncbi:hypothetical protein [Paenibacillus nasutitermitis]|uniref:Uncharacterized protein n=1 Tax=Paenibacillus nasutitermitis TaxID=1652958 RepID=A0A916Z3P1_9BACL|nr:hypothetical protein [Paenibacillus nasutitermitis]GGD75404.1 hypothetical protein GCM10010911_36680 [Paenibacillus nasutitermitis]
MHICFVEYQISEDHANEYRAWMKIRQAENSGFQLFEGTDQPLLFVEVWEAPGEEAAMAIKKERCSERSSWHAMVKWVPRGASGIHAWTFRPING